MSTELDETIGVLGDALVALTHAQLFITSREKMHQDGIILHRIAIQHVRNELARLKDQK